MKRETPFAPGCAKSIAAIRGTVRPAGWFTAHGLLVLLFGAVAPMLAQTSGTWQAQDIGSVAAAGRSTVSGGTFTIAGSGADIWGATDEFHFYAQTLAGDGTITARVTGIANTNPWAKAGVMIRETLAPNAPHVFLAATPDWHGIVALQRSSPGGETASRPGPAVYAPYWLRLTRIGNGITAATSADGTTWTTTGSFATSMGGTVYIGLAVSSHNDGTLCTATFDNVAVAAAGNEGGPPTAPANVAATAISSSQIALSWTNTSTAQTEVSIWRARDGSFAEVARVAGTATSHTDSGLSPSTTYSYQLRGINSSGYGPVSNTASATTTAPPPGGAWQSADIGTSTAGQTSASGDAVTLTGSGRGIGGTADGLRYYCQSVGTGDCEIIVRVGSLQNTNSWAKAGIMLRASLDPGSPHAAVWISGQHGTGFQWRSTANGDTQSSTPTEDGGAPRWLKLVFRAASTDASEPIPARAEAYVSPDGVSWISAWGFNIWSGSSDWQFIGLFVTSANEGTSSAAQFDHLRLLTPPPAPGDFRVTQRGPNGEINLAWSYPTTDVDRFVIRTNRQRAGDHDWHIAATVPGSARQAAITIGNSDGASVEIKAFRDFVRSPAARLWAQPTITPSLSVRGTTSNAVALRVTEDYGINGGENGPWSIERSSDGLEFVEIASGLTPTGSNNAYSVYGDYTDTGLPAGVTRYYRARELRADGDRSAYSNIVSATTTLSGASPAAPTALRITGITSNQIQLGWTDNATNETGYQVERSTDGTTFSLLATLAADAAQYTDNPVAASTAYYYRVRAVNDAGTSSYSNHAGARTSAPGASAPSAPTELTATALSSSQIQLNWTDNASDETTFEIQRSSDGVTFGITYSGSAPNTTSMTDTALPPSTTYHYRVRAVNSAGASAYSNIAHATTPATSSPPPGDTWQSGDVGSVAISGSDSTSGQTVTVTGGGTDIWDRADSFRFRYQALNGDGSITARVVNMTNTDNWAKAGVMIRNSLLAGSRNVFAAVTPTWNGVTAQARRTDGDATTSTRGPGVNAPYWLRLTRAGSMFTAEASTDGVTWTTYATFSVIMNQIVAVGLAVTSHNQNAVCTATFDNVTVTSAGAPPPPPAGTWSAADIGAVGVAGSHTASGSAITISGSGADIWGTADAFRFVWQTRTGDGVVEAQVASMGNTNGWAKAGVMIRESANANAPNVFVALTPTWHGIVAQARSAAGAETTSAAGPARNAPYWVRLARSGNTFTASTSPDGVTWTPFATYDVAMSATAQFGFAVTSHDNAQLNQAVFQEPYVGAP